MATNEVREFLGKRVREVWIGWALKQGSPKPSWLVPWDQLSEPDKEVDRQIGEALWEFGLDCGAAVCRCAAEEERVYTAGEQGERFAMPKERCAEAIDAFKVTGMFSLLGGPYANSARTVKNPLSGV